ncbi:hypothetical protein CA13_02280 [Planctomycetes bacterium CA13]|uniref:Transposase IS200-like domain-containing protein n=2 Tax=Novipirellula herctigrandis TaxID=2527986 RepID=A0A5C5YVP5_9BACT|nr:hypothetical protein CA13_02280 [Planctomycetes bacterium CA13]
MPNHLHLVLQPSENGGMSHFLRWSTLTHTMRYHAHYHTEGEGYVYQGRFKSFPVQDDDHFLDLCRYVERNAKRARLCGKGRGLAMGIALSLVPRPRTTAKATGTMADPPFVELDQASQRVARRQGIRSNPMVDS